MDVQIACKDIKLKIILEKITLARITLLNHLYAMKIKKTRYQSYMTISLTRKIFEL